MRGKKRRLINLLRNQDKKFNLFSNKIDSCWNKNNKPNKKLKKKRKMLPNKLYLPCFATSLLWFPPSFVIVIGSTLCSFLFCFQREQSLVISSLQKELAHEKSTVEAHQRKLQEVNKVNTMLQEQLLHERTMRENDVNQVKAQARMQDGRERRARIKPWVDE